MIYVDESVPVGDFEPQFHHRQVTIKRCRDVHAQYEMLHEIGRGKFGRVLKCRHREENADVYYAAKFVLCSKREDRRNVEREVEIMNKLNDPKLLYLYDAYDNGRNELCLVTEYIGGGELFDRVIEDEFVLTEKACAAFMRQIVEAVAYIHKQHIIHLDLKPENIMCLTKTGNRIKIIDFGLARTYEPQKKLQVLFGTPEFVAPEVVAFEPISFATDMWAVGVICYVLLSGLSPFMGDTDLETMANVTIAEYDYEDEAFNNISSDAKNFIDKLLVKEKEKRFTAAQCLQHPWLNLNSDLKKDEKSEQQIAGKQNLSHQRDNKTEEQNYVFDSHSKTMCFAGGQKSLVTSLMDVENDEEMSDVDCRKRAGDKDVSTDSAVQRKRSKTPSDECDELTSRIVTRPIITLDQVKHKADEILEGKRNSLSDECDVTKTKDCDDKSVTKAVVSDENKFHLSVVDETLWQAAERTLTPMWEIATTGNDVTQAMSPARNVTPSSNMDENYLHHDKVSGCDVTSVLPLTSVPLQSNEQFLRNNDNSAKILRQTSCHVEARQVSPIWEENPVQEFKSEDQCPQAEFLQTIEIERSPSLPWKSKNKNDSNSGSTGSQKLFWGIDEENGDSESLLDELQDLMDCKNWCTPGQKSTASTPSLSTKSTVDISPLSDLMKEVDEQIRFNVDSSNFLPHKQQQQQQQQQQHQQQHQQPMMSQTNNGRGVGSLDRFVDVREDILQMKNELNALKKDLSSAKRGLEFDKKPLMDIMNRLDSPRLKPFTNNPAFSNVSRHSSARDMLDTEEALEDMKKTMTADFGYTSGSGQLNGNLDEVDPNSDNPHPIRKVFKSANTGSVNQFKSRFEQKSVPVVCEVRQDPVARILNPRKKSVTPFRTATKSPSPVSPAPPPLPPSIRRRSPSPVCTGNVSRVRSRFESGGSTTTTSMSNQPRVATPTSLSTSKTSTSSTANHHQTLPKTFKLRETLNPVSTFESRIYSSPSNGLNRFGGSVMHLNDNLSNKPRFTGLPSVTARQVYQPLDQATSSPCSPPPPRTKGLLERQSSMPCSATSATTTSTTQNRFLPNRQLNQDLIHGAATFLTQALPVNGVTASRTKVKGPFGYTDL